MKWDRLRLFNVVAQAKSLTESAEILNLSQSALSRQMQSLEQELGNRLFVRRSRGIELTPAGIQVAESARQLSKSIEDVNQKLFSDKSKPSGKLRVYSTNAFGSLWLAPRMTSFLDKYPEIEMALSLRDAEPRVTPANAHAEIRMTPMQSQDYIQIKLTSFRYRIFASTSYLRMYGVPMSSKDLDKHKLIAYGEDAQPPLDRRRLNWLLWHERENTPRKPVLEVSSIYGIARSVEAGIGIASLPDWMEKEMKNLFEVLLNLSGPKLEIYLCYHEQMRDDPRINVLKEHLQGLSKREFSRLYN
tara:strand:- start:4583 stop:5488 length:906 start_codon:yes stop_codon:yes gene_type:complete